MIIAIIGRRLAERETTDKGFGSAPTTGQGRGQICVRSDPTVICLYFLDLSFFLSIFFHILSWFLCIFSEMEEYIAHQLFYPRKKTFSHNSLLLETHNILTFRGEEYTDQNTKYQNRFHEPAVKYINLSHPPLLKIHPFCGSFKCRLSGPHPQLH